MNRINQLYCAYINFPQEKRDIKFLYLEIEIYNVVRKAHSFRCGWIAQKILNFSTNEIYKIVRYIEK